MARSNVNHAGNNVTRVAMGREFQSGGQVVQDDLVTRANPRGDFI